VLSATTLVNVETITLTGGTYNITTDDATVAAGQTLTVNGSALSAANLLTFNGSAETDGSFVITGGADSDVLTGGAGADILAGGKLGDTISGGAGADTFEYFGVADSTGVTYDTVVGFDAASDVFWIPTAVNAVDAPVLTGALSSGVTFNAGLTAAIAGHLPANDAMLFTANSGSLSGHTFLIVDAIGTTGYQAGADYVMDLKTGTNLGSLAAANFHT
jgi:Ca2+-binding RTX toxin-like protein